MSEEKRMPDRDHRPSGKQPHLMIGKVAGLYDITVQTLRHYDKIGLFQPEVINPETGYRYYSVAQLRQLEYILFLRQLQYSLPQIQEAMDSFQTEGSLEDTLAECQTQLSARIRELETMLGRVRRLREIPEGPEEPKGVVSIRAFSPPRKYLFRPIRSLQVGNPEFPLRLMDERKKLLGDLPPIQTDYSFSASVSLKDFRETGILRYSGVLLDPGLFGQAPPLGNMELPEGYYAVVRFDRNEVRVKDMYRLLSDFLEKHNFRCDDTVVECGMDRSFSSISRLSRMTELQVRIFMD